MISVDGLGATASNVILVADILKFTSFLLQRKANSQGYRN